MIGSNAADSAAEKVAEALVAALGRENAHRAIDMMLRNFTTVELAALAANWNGFWARAKQVAPATDWRTWGFLTGRGFGKTRAVSKWVNDEVEAGRAFLISLAAQDEENCIALQVEGPSGLIATAPPWFKPRFEATAKQLVWPNGARAYVRTPEVPGKIRGLEYHLSWICELQSWPAATREEALSNVRLSTRLGYARIVWDSTPKKKHPLLLDLLGANKRSPEEHVVVRGRMSENAGNLGKGFVAEMIKNYAGTAKGKEELDGEMLDDAENATAKQEWIDRHRRVSPDSYARRGIAVDVAVTKRAGSDRSGIVEGGLGVDGQGYVVADYSGKHSPGEWGKLVVDAVVNHRLDVVVAETNKGGDLVAQNLRAEAASRDPKLTVVIIGKDERPQHVPGIIYVKEVHARGEKADRAQPLSTAYQRGRVSHVRGANLEELETTLTTWEPTPGARSPDDLDACVHIMSEMLDLTSDVVAPATAEGIDALTKALTTEPTSEASTLAQSLAQAFGYYGPSGI